MVDKYNVILVNGLVIIRKVLLKEKMMRRKSIIFLVIAGLCLALIKLPPDVILNLTLGSLAVTFSGWLLNRNKATKPA